VTFGAAKPKLLQTGEERAHTSELEKQAGKGQAVNLSVISDEGDAMSWVAGRGAEVTRLDPHAAYIQLDISIHSPASTL
jgi:hypothetical protein